MVCCVVCGVCRDGLVSFRFVVGFVKEVGDEELSRVCENFIF